MVDCTSKRRTAVRFTQETRRKARGATPEDRKDLRYANITIIEGHGASQYGIGIVSARIAEMIVTDERAVIPIGSFQKTFGVTFSLPSIVGRAGVIEVLEPEISEEERAGLQKSAEFLKSALKRVGTV